VRGEGDFLMKGEGAGGRMSMGVIKRRGEWN